MRSVFGERVLAAFKELYHGVDLLEENVRVCTIGYGMIYLFLVLFGVQMSTISVETVNQ